VCEKGRARNKINAYDFGAETGNLKEKYDSRHCFKLKGNIKIGDKNILID
jgi:hypothetical protein